MLYLGIDLHSKQITVCVRNESGEITLRRQVSTRPEKIDQFFEQLTKSDAEFIAIVEVCGFNDWFTEKLREWKCCDILLVQPERTSNRKTDSRDANKLCELLWCNRHRLSDGKQITGLRRVQIPTKQQAADRQLTSLRKRLAVFRTKSLNKIRRILKNSNLQWNYPTKSFQTQSGRSWLKEVKLSAMDRIEMDILLEQWEMFDRQIESTEQQIQRSVQKTQPGEVMSDSQILMTTPGVAGYGALTITSRIGDISRFPSPRSLANYFGITPGCRNSGEAKQRLGSITKQGSGIVRFMLGQQVVHVLKKDARMRAWYRRIKNRRGSKIARVAVMRRLTTIYWHMLTYRERYTPGGPPRLKLKAQGDGSADTKKSSAA